MSSVLNVLYRDAFEHSQKFAFESEEECKNEKTLKEKFRDLYSPLESLAILRHNFNTRTQQPVENFKAYFTVIRIMAESHKFGQERSNMLKSRVVVGNRNKKNP